jgi:hypothetical protein
MSLSRALIAIRGDRDHFRELFLRVWGYYRLVAVSPALNSLDEFTAWSEPRCGYLKGEHPNDVKAFWQDGDWAVLLDLSMLLIDEPARLAALSREAGVAAAGLTQGTSGTAMFSLFEDGSARREIARSEGALLANFGEPLAAEAGLRVADGFYIDELERLWAGLGLSPFWSEPRPPLVALHVIETGDYGVPLPSNGKKKPWWKFWGAH